MKTIDRHLQSEHRSYSIVTVLTSLFVIGFSLTGTSQSQLAVNLVRGTERDSAVIYFYEDDTRTFGDNLDEEETFSGNFSLYTTNAAGDYLTCIGLPHFDCDENVALEFFNANEGHYNLEFSRCNTFREEISIQLVDHFTNTITSVIAQPMYSFDITSDPDSYNPGRFELRFQATPASQDFKVSGSTKCHGSDGEIEISNTQPGIIYAIFQDNEIVASIVGTGDTIKHLLPVETIEDGVNSFQVKSGFPYCQTDDYKTVNVIVNHIFPTPVASSYRCDEGSLELEATMIPEGGVFKWYDSQDAVTPILTQSESTFKTPSLDQTKTYYVSSTTVFGCEGPRQAVFAEITMPVPAAITASGDTLRSNYTFGNQWYFNGKIIPGATSPNYQATESGIYSVGVNIRSCSSTADFVYGGISKPFIVTAHPNPVATQVTVTVSGEISDLGDLQVLNSVGKHVATVLLYADGNKRVGQIDMSNFPVGIYVVRAHGDESTELKLIKL